MNKKQKLKKIKNKIKIQRRADDKKIRPLTIKRDKLFEEVETEEGEKLIGKCFKFRNSYSSSEKWWLYSKVIGAKGMEVDTLEIQEPPGTSLEIKIENRSKNAFVRRDSYITITKTEFDKAYKKAIKRLEDAYIRGKVIL